VQFHFGTGAGSDIKTTINMPDNLQSPMMSSDLYSPLTNWATFFVWIIKMFIQIQDEGFL